MASITDDSLDTITKKMTDISSKTDKQYKHVIVWHKAIWVTLQHVLAVLGIYYFISGQITLWETCFFITIAIFGSLGIQCGAHRLWSHRSYKANLPLRIILMILDTLAFQEDIVDWSRDHRGHHKHSDTDGDPYNSNRGFFFCHMGWIYVKKHPDVITNGKKLDISDLLSDPVVSFQRRFYLPLVFLIWGLIPIASAMYLFDMPFIVALSFNSFRYVMALHLTWTVNSVAHLYGMRQYDTSINPRNSPLVMYWGLGEGYHNYHHVFPYDYSASEFGWLVNWNPATAFIDFFAWLGWAYDLKKAPKETVKNRTERSGDLKLYEDSKNVHYPYEVVKGILATLSPIIVLLCLRGLYSVSIKSV